MRKYRASNHTSFGSFLLLLILGILSAAALGGILWAVDNYLHFYLVIAFPLFAGLIAGGLLVLGVRSGKVRSPILAALVGLVTGVLIFGVYHFATYYVTFRNDARTIYIKNVGETPTDAELDQAIDALFLDKTDGVGSTGFIGYLKFTARIGLTITNSTSVTSTDTSGDIDIKDQWAFVYWGVEILLAGIIAAVLAGREAGQPFDEDANAWYGKPTVLAVATLKARKPLDKALNDGDFQTAGSLLTTQNIRYPRNEVLLRRSPAATGSMVQQDIYLTVNFCQRRGRSVVKKSGLISPSELDLMKRSIAQGESQNAAAVRR